MDGMIDAPQTTVHNLKHEAMRAGDVRIDRRTALGNEFVLGAHGGRMEVIAKFAAAERARLASQPARRAAVQALHGRRLFCWCAPLACHGDVLALLAAELVECDG